jgi:hypothetical protein
MMRSPLMILAASLGVLLLAQSSARAQITPPYQGGVGPQGFYGPLARPTLSPYLNIVGGGNPAINYYGQTNPLFNQRAIDQRLLSTPPPAQAISTPEIDELLPSISQTGHLAGFQNFSPFFGQASQQRSYYPYNPTGGIGGTAAATAARPAGGPGTAPPMGPRVR